MSEKKEKPKNEQDSNPSYSEHEGEILLHSDVR
jgi:hypothetical protein